MKKQILLIFILAIGVVALSGCPEKDAPPDDSSPTPEIQPPETTPPDTPPETTTEEEPFPQSTADPNATDGISVVFEEPFRVTAGDAHINMSQYTGFSGPMWIDLDSDGLDDLLVGCIRGYMQFFRNIGTKTDPVFEDQGLLQIAGEDIRVHNW